jgi:hypothetical protein
MTLVKRVLRSCSVLLLGLTFAWACGFDDTLREYLSERFWLPFAKRHSSFERPNVRRISAPFAGMTAEKGDRPLAKLRTAYQEIAEPVSVAFEVAPIQQAVAAARADQSLTDREKEEVDLIDAKIDMRSAGEDDLRRLESARKKLKAFLRMARTPEFLSEARGWLAHVHYILGDQTAAGKIYLDELNRNGSNLSRETLLKSLRMTYGYDGGPQLLAHLEEYFDTPEHAAFAIQLATNPRWDRGGAWDRAPERSEKLPQSGLLIKALLEKHSNLLRSSKGADTLALLTMRTALHLGDPVAVRRLAGQVPAGAGVRSEPDFNWMLASALYLSHEYAAAETPLLALFQSARSSDNQKAAAAYGICGVYFKTGNVIERLRYALWLHTAASKKDLDLSYPSQISGLAVYWAGSGWDLNMLLDAEASVEVLRSFVNQNPGVPDIRLVKYSLAVRLTREDRYDEAADVYQSISAIRRTPRIRQLAALHKEANRSDLPDRQRQEARYKLAEFIGANPNGIYFNEALWHGFQRYAFQASRDGRLTRTERQTLMASERKLKDGQEERWRAYLILREIVREAGQTELGRKAAVLALSCLRGISDRFERAEEIRKADIELSTWLRRVPGRMGARSDLSEAPPHFRQAVYTPTAPPPSPSAARICSLRRSAASMAEDIATPYTTAPNAAATASTR